MLARAHCVLVPGLLGAGLSFAVGPQASAQLDPGAPAGAVQTVHSGRAFDDFDLPVAPFGAGPPATRRLEGAVDRRAYRLDDPQATVAEVMGAYRARLADEGFQPVFECVSDGCGGFDFRFGAEILPPPGMLVDVRDFAQLSMRRAGADGGDHVSVLVSRVLDAIHVQTVAVHTEPGPDEIAIVGSPDGETPLGTAILPQDEQALLSALRRDGHVPVEGLAFETGGVRLSPGSAEALDMVSRILQRDEGLSVLIVGHSDNEGPLQANIALSRHRAESVMQALVERGAPPDRMEAHGAGFLAPVATNATEEGRAANRRVELVLR